MGGLKKKAYLIVIIIIILPIMVLGERMINFGDSYIFAGDGNKVVTSARVDTESGIEAKRADTGLEGKDLSAVKEDFSIVAKNNPDPGESGPGMGSSPVVPVDSAGDVTDGTDRSYDGSPDGETDTGNVEESGVNNTAVVNGEETGTRSEENINETQVNDSSQGYYEGNDSNTEIEDSVINPEGSRQETGSGIEENDAQDIDYNESSSFRIEVDLNIQKVFVFYRDMVIREMVCSGGTDEKPTPLGEFTTTQKIEYAWVEKFGMGAYYWTRFFEDYLFHSVPFDSEGNLMVEEAGKLGSPASHGCIRMAVDDARWLYETLPLGVRVLIYR
ncbi:MAG: L,D-transpeptidase [Actinobacteria bacterium]|nr:L,D-transpeptidase [Actinomycetota bacterium]